jgi:Tol biopolymer transport system component
MLSGQRCDRAYAAGGTIACLRPVRDAEASTDLVVLDGALTEKKSVPLKGHPNQATVSASGRMIAWTLLTGAHSVHGYGHPGVTTSTGILDTRTGQVTNNLDGFAITRLGKPYQATDLVLWGVSFAKDDNRFYATLATGGFRYLVEGDLAARTARTLAENVESPALSPDGTRIAYKQALDGAPSHGWRLSVLDLAGQKVTPLAETRGVDDQPAWLDGGTIAYAVQTGEGINDIWTVPADGTGPAQLLIPQANSPAAV